MNWRRVHACRRDCDVRADECLLGGHSAAAQHAERGFDQHDVVVGVSHSIVHWRCVSYSDVVVGVGGGRLICSVAHIFRKYHYQRLVYDYQVQHQTHSCMSGGWIDMIYSTIFFISFIPEECQLEKLGDLGLVHVD